MAADAELLRERLHALVDGLDEDVLAAHWRVPASGEPVPLGVALDGLFEAFRAQAELARRVRLWITGWRLRFVEGCLWLVAGYHTLAVVTLVDPRRLGMDAHAYWLAGRHLSYALPPRAVGAYLYSPVFAEALRPFTVLPWPAFAALWWTVLVVGYVWLLRPLGWRWALPFGLLGSEELTLGNVNIVLALMCVAALRRPAWWAVGVLTKVTPGVLGVLWHLAHRELRAVVEAALVVAVLVGVSVLAAPSAWSQWLHLLASSGSVANIAPLPVRFAVGAVVLIAAGAAGRRWPVPVALFVASPLTGWPTLAVLAAVPRLVLADRKRRRGETSLTPVARIT